MKRSLTRGILAGLAITAVGPFAALGNVYPTNLGQSSSSLNWGLLQTTDLSFLLNDEATGGVKVEVLNSSNAVVRTFNLAGTQSRGVHTVSWDGKDDSAVGVAPGDYSFRVTAMHNGYGDWTKISDDTNNLLRFNSPRGVAVNQDKNSPFYGRIYIANSVAGTVSGGPTLGDGIYLRNADGSDSPVGQGFTALTAGLDFSASTSSSPWRLEVGPDNNLYLSDWSDAHGGIELKAAGLYQANGNMSGTAKSVLNNDGRDANGLNAIHGSIASSAIVTGSIAGGDLKVYALDEDFDIDGGAAGPFQSFLRWDINGGPLPHNTAPTSLMAFPSTTNLVRGVTVDLARSPTDGKFFLMQNRSGGAEAGIFVVSSDGSTVLWNSLDATRLITGNAADADFLRQSRGVAISPDGKTMAIVTDGSDLWIIPLDADGLPDLNQRVFLDVGTITIGRDIGFDAAGNVYLSTSGHARVSIYSPPGANSSFTDSLGPIGAITVIPEPVSLLTLSLGGLLALRRGRRR